MERDRSPMKLSPAAIALRVCTVAFSASLLGGYVWFTQWNAQSAPPPAPPATVASTDSGNPQGVAAPHTPEQPDIVMLGTKSPGGQTFTNLHVRKEWAGPP